MISEIGEYKGNKVLTFKKDADDKYPFSFGYAKAKIIVDNIETIKEFVATCEAEKQKKEETK
jgi:hypothetical protein